MKKGILLALVLVVAFSLFGVWGVGDEITDDYTWTIEGTEYSLFNLIDSGKVVTIFWGSTG
ncbi:MAG: hypothetical protein K8S23_07990 [Candidatus Cloacimonetes bacterium]|nr:hypothetical protein [Candidatus Cloacimonadota bacterium]